MVKLFCDKMKVHLGYNVQRLREILGVKQFALAENCGWSQQQISKIENTKFLNEETLRIVSKGLGVSPELIFWFSDNLILAFLKNVSNSKFLGEWKISENFELSHLGFIDDIKISLSEENSKEELFKSLVISVNKLECEIKNIKKNL
jgi:transcriptional regulator with XRE-family HTH domain